MWWWHTPLIPTLEKQREVDFCEFEVSLVYRENSRTARATERNTVSKNKTKYVLLQEIRKVILIQDPKAVQCIGYRMVKIFLVNC